MDKISQQDVMEDFKEARPTEESGGTGLDIEAKLVYSIVSNILLNISNIGEFIFSPFGPALENDSFTSSITAERTAGLFSSEDDATGGDAGWSGINVQSLLNFYSSVVFFSLNNIVPLLFLWCLNRGVVRSKVLSNLLSLSILWLILLILSPVAVLGFGLLFLIRGVLGLYLRLRYNGRVFLPSAMDAVWGVESYASTSINTGFYIIQGKCDFNKVRERINATVECKLDGKEMMDRLKCSVCTIGGFICWEKLEDFDVDRQVKNIHNLDSSLPKEMEMSDVFSYLQKVHDHPFSRKDEKGGERAPWEVLVVPNFRHDENNNVDHYALIFRMNHSLMDGISFGNILHMCLADKPFRFTLDPMAPINVSKTKQLIGYALAVVNMPLVVVRNLVLREKHAFHGPMLTGQKNFAWSRPIRMDMLKLMKNRSKTSIFAVLMSSIAGSIRQLFLSKGLPVPDIIHAAPPVAILPYPDRRPRNKFAIVLFPVPIGVQNSLNRLRKVYDIAQAMAKSSEIFSSYLTIRILGIMPAFFIRLMGVLAHATLTLSNMPGPGEKVTLFQGDPLVDIGAWVPVKYSIGIGTAMFSYDDRLRVTFIADEAVLPNPSDVPKMQAVFENQLSELAKSLGIMENIFVHSNPYVDSHKVDTQG